MEGQNRALDVILELMHGEMARLQDLCLEAMQANVEALHGMEAEKILSQETLHCIYLKDYICKNCRTFVSKEDRFCRGCGRRFTGDQTKE